MCGIGAIIRSEAAAWSDADRARVGRATQRLSRRGPDSGAARWSIDGRWVLLHRRLAIQDLSDAAAQPMTSADGLTTLIYNGEIYNAPRLRNELRHEGRDFRTRSDTEILLEALSLWGIEKTLDRVRGMFAFVALRHGGGQRRVLAAIDHVGMKPLAWRMDVGGTGGPTLTIGSDCDVVRGLTADAPEVDASSLARVLSVGYCPAPRTMWRGVHKLAPGTAMEWIMGDPAGPRVWRYWRPPVGVDEPGAADKAAEFEQLLGEVTREHLIGDVPVGVFLSAGLDSTSIALALHTSGADTARTGAYTLAAGQPDSTDDETPLAADTAHRLGMPHRVIRFTPGELVDAVRLAARVFDEPQGFTAMLTMLRIAGAVRAAEPGLKVVLSGDGADEALGGYAWHRDALTHPLSLEAFVPPSSADAAEHAMLAAVVAGPNASTSGRIAAMHALGRISYASRYAVRTFGGFHPSEAAALLGLPGPKRAGGDFADWLEADDAERLPHPRRAQRLDLLGLCAGSILPKVDRACMDVGLELRSPYLDRRMLEWTLRRPVDPRERQPGGSKGPIRAMLSRGVERGLVPPGIMTRPKQGFSLRLADEAFEALVPIVAESRLLRDGLLRPDWAMYLTDDREMRRVRLFTLAMVAAWHDAKLRVPDAQCSA